VARGFSGMTDHLTLLIQRAISHRGFSVVDILQPCVSFNKVNTHAWYKKRCYELPNDYDPNLWETAMKTAMEWGERIPVGVIYRNKRPTYEDHFPVLKDGPLVGRGVDQEKLRWILEGYT
ncbi:MAG: 2-oxoacid ferredoxin oxidoreductase, partial [Pseudomonadota bacterium]